VRRVKHHPAPAYAEIAAFLKTLTKQPGGAAQALRLLILTAARTNEVIAAVRSEFDLDRATWTISAERMKAERAHRVPLSAQAVEVVQALLDSTHGEFLFPGARRVSPCRTWRC
jgi:integrase